MKKIILAITLILAIAIVSGYTKGLKNAGPDENTKQASIEDLRNYSNAEVKVSDLDHESTASDKLTESKPRVLLLLNNSTGMSKWSPSLWWNYRHASAGQAGC